jgi:Flp pilus assembly protein TadG
VNRERGQTLVEFALIAPLLVLLLLAILDFGRALYAFSTISNAAREGARIAIVDQGPASGGVSLAAQEAANQATALGLNPSDPAQVQVSYLEPDLVAACPSHAVNCVAQVRVQYQFRAVTPVIGNILGSINLTTTTKIPIERTFQSP